MGIYKLEELQADKTSVTEQKVKDASRNITNIIKDINKKGYIDVFQIIDGQLVYIGDNEEEIIWSNEIGIESSKDIIPPDTELMELIENPNTWTNTNVTVTAIYPSDVVVKQYRVLKADNSVVVNWTNYTTPITVSENGQVDIRGEDAAGNVSGTKSKLISKIDKELPTLNINPINVIVDLGVEYDLLTGVSVTDNLSGIKGDITYTSNPTFDINKIETYTITYTVSDNANNISNVNRTIKVQGYGGLTNDTLVYFSGQQNIDNIYPTGYTKTEKGSIVYNNTGGPFNKGYVTVLNATISLSKETEIIPYTVPISFDYYIYLDNFSGVENNSNFGVIAFIGEDQSSLEDMVVYEYKNKPDAGLLTSYSAVTTNYWDTLNSSNFIPNSWNYIAMQFNGDSRTVWVNGNSTGSRHDPNRMNTNRAGFNYGKIYLFSGPSTYYYPLNNRIANLRIQKGLNFTGTNITVPTEPYTK